VLKYADDMALPLIPVQFREKDPKGRVSLVNMWTREYLEEHGIGLTEGLDIHLCQRVIDDHGALDWEYAEGCATYVAESGFWLAELHSPPGRASSSPLGHWSRRIPKDLLGPLPGNRFLDLDLVAAAIDLRGESSCIVADGPGHLLDALLERWA
jgi:hypothetical protein